MKTDARDEALITEIADYFDMLASDSEAFAARGMGKRENSSRAKVWRQAAADVRSIELLPRAALAQATAPVRVKGLEWVDFPDRGAKAQAWNEANYMIQKWSDGRWEISASYPGYSTFIEGTDRFYPTLEAAKSAAQADYEARILAALEAPPDAGVVAELVEARDDWDELMAEARAEAAKAMRKFPQPNYVISKIAEEAGEVVKAAIHCAEGRETAENLRGEMKQTLAMLYRLWVEGDQVHGLPPVRAALAKWDAK